MEHKMLNLPCQYPPNEPAYPPSDSSQSSSDVPAPPISSSQFNSRCHNSFPKLSPTQPPPPPFGQVSTTDLVQNPTGYIDRCRPYPTGPLGPISVAFQPMAKTPVRSGPHWPQRPEGLPRSCDHHVMLVQPHIIHTASSASHLAGGPGT